MPQTTPVTVEHEKDNIIKITLLWGVVIHVTIPVDVIQKLEEWMRGE